MASYHNNQLNVVGLFDSESNNSPGPSSGILASALSGFSGATDSGNGYLHGYGHAALVNYGFGSRPVEPERFIAGPIGNQGQEHEDEARFKTEDNMSPVQFKSPTWKRVLEKVKRSLVVKLKIGRHGMDTKNEQPEAHVLPVNGIQPETSMLSMNGTNGIQAGAHMLTTNNTQAEVHMLPTDNMQAGSYMPSTNNMLPANNTHAGGLALPVNNLFSGTPSPAPWAQSYHHLYQGHLQGTQLSQSVSPDQKRYNRNHVVAGNGMFDEDDYLIATVEELRPLESIFTPGTDLFRGQYLYTEPLNDLHSQAQGLLDLPNDMDFSSFTNDESPLVNHDNQDYVFKTES